MRFYVKAIEDNVPWLFIQKMNGALHVVATSDYFIDFGLNTIDFNNMKKDEIKEVFLNLED